MTSYFNMGNVLVKSAVIDVGIQWAGFAVSAALKTEKFYDLLGSGTFLYLAYKSLQWGKRYFARQKIQTGLVMVWALRLGLYLFSRILKDGHDRRFDKVRNVPTKFFLFWTVQAVWVFITLLPTLILNAKQHDEELSTRDYIGWGIWGLGFFFEALSDYQKSEFRADPDNAGKFITSGLWSLSRHPNYFGEILVWAGLFISASSVMRGSDYISLISPIFVTFLLTKVSGVPLLERSAMKRWGTDPLYQEYVRKTPVLIPFLY